MSHTESLYDFNEKDGTPTEHKTVWFDSFELGTQTKQIDEDTEVQVATFKGVANVMDHEDLGGDIIHKGAFKKTLAEKDGKVPFVTDHTYKINNYVGMAYLEEQNDELRANVEVLLTDNPTGKEFLTKAKHANSHEDPFGLSIGFDVPKGKSEHKEGTRHIYEVNLWEVSGVLFPMNELSRAVGFKNIAELKEYSKTDLVKARKLIDSLLDHEPEDSTPDNEAELLKHLDKLKPNQTHNE